MTTNCKNTNNIPATVGKINMPIKFNFAAPVTINLTYNGGAAEEKPACSDKPTEVTPAPIKSATTQPAEYKYDSNRRTGCGRVAEASLENRIFDKIVEKFGVKRDSLISITPFVSAYEMYAIGTRGDVTFLAWQHPSGQLFVQQQCW